MKPLPFYVEADGGAEAERRGGNRIHGLKRTTLTTRELIIATGAYFIALIAVAYFTRATARRIAGALAGGGVVGLAVIGVTALSEALGWWRVPGFWTPGKLPIYYFGWSISVAPIYLVTWRIARRFGRRGLAAVLCGIAIVGPLRDYRIAKTFPEWIVFGPGVAPVLAVAATYVGTVALGHALMRLVAGPAGGDPLARRPESAPNALS